MNNHKTGCKGINVPPDILKKANEGDATAQLELGKIYFNAISVENHDTIAFNWILRSAEQGRVEAQFKLGDLYALGYGTAKSLPDSYKWYTKAAIKGYKKALIRIHNLYQMDIKMHCRGQLDSKDLKPDNSPFNSPFLRFKSEKKIRELFEYRLEQKKNTLNGAIEHYTHQFKHYQSSDQNDPVVQLNLAFLYQHGYGVKKCSRWAFEYYLLAAEQENVDAQYNLGYLYQQHINKKFNYRDALKWYTKSAHGGHMASQRCLAYFYLKGLATGIDYKVAISWYTKAAKAGDAQSQVALGLLYRKGDYIKQDLEMAVRWYTLAARQNNIVAKNCLSQLHQRGMLNDIELEKDILEYLTEESMNTRLCSKLSVDVSKLGNSPESKYMNDIAKHALIGDGPSMYAIGLSYYNGNSVFPQDKDTGIKWIKNSGNREHNEAQFMMAKLYKEGDSIEQDYHKSSIWYRKIAKKKDAEAQCQVGIMYNEGLGVRKDPLEASKWFYWAADQENSEAQFNWGMLRLKGEGIQQDVSEASEWFLKSIRQRNIGVCYIVGKMYFGGKNDLDRMILNHKYGLGRMFSDDRYGLERDQKMGFKLLEFAAKNDHEMAQLLVGALYDKGGYVQKDIPKSIDYYTMAADSGNARAQYKLAITYFNEDDANQDYTKLYSFFKPAKDNGFSSLGDIFNIPLRHNSDIKDYSKVITMFTEVTEKGIDDLSFNIGSLYEHGITNIFIQLIEINYAEAEKWYLLASKNGDSRADYRLGLMHENGKGVERNMNTAVNYYNNAIEKENCDAMYRLACIYLSGHRVAQNLLQAFHLYTKASNMGYKRATEGLTFLREDVNFRFQPSVFPNRNQNQSQSQDPEKLVDEKKLIRMLKKATRKGYTQLQYQLGLKYERDNDNSIALKWFSLAANIGVTDSYYRLGVMYEEGRGVEQNYPMAAYLYRKATEKEHEHACFRLGQLYLNGNGVKQNYLKAYIFYKKAAVMDHDIASKFLNITQEISIKANGDTEKNHFNVQSKNYKKSFTMCKYVAEHGDPEVQFKVGFAYEYCYPQPNYKEAFKWYSMAAKRSHKDAIYHLGLIYEKGSGISQNHHKAIQLYEQAFQLGSDDALYRLATVYHHGKGVDIDQVKAFEYYSLSAKLGNPKYQCKLGQLYEEGELVQKNTIESLKWYTKAYLQGYDDTGSRLFNMYEHKPYESFFFEKLFRNLSIASEGYFRLRYEYKYSDYGDINNRMGVLCYFGLGTDKNLKQSIYYFFKEYTSMTRRSVEDFGFFQYPDFSFSEKNDILNEFVEDDEYMDQLGSEEMYLLGQLYYDGMVAPRGNSKDTRLQHDQEMDKYRSKSPGEKNYDPDMNFVIKKDYLKALNLLNKAADKNHDEALFQLGKMYYYGDGVKRNTKQGDIYFALVSHTNYNLMMKIAVLFHVDNKAQDFSNTVKYYKKLENALSTDSGISDDEKKRINSLVQIGLGLLYEYGDGVEQDYKQAFDYYKEVSDNKYEMGHLRLGLMHYYGKGIPVDYKKAYDLFEQIPANSIWEYQFPYVYDQNNFKTNDTDDYQRNLVYCTKNNLEITGEAYYYLGLMYKHGQGVPKDENKAQRYFNEAFDLGCQRARNEIKR